MLDSKYEIDWNSVTIDQIADFEAVETHPQQLFEISDEVLDAYYQASQELYAEKNYADSRDAFTFLTFLNPTYPNFWIGLGLSEKNLGHIEKALSAFQAAEMLDPENPQTLANLYKFYTHINQPEAADKAYQKCLEICNQKPEFADLKETVDQLKQS